MVMGTARKSTSYRPPRRVVPTVSEPFRGIPPVKTCKVPVLEVQATKTVTRTLRNRKLESDSMTYTTKEVPREGPFNFLGLPAELRIRIYEMCVSVTEYITYDDKDYCTCGGNDHRSQSHSGSNPNCKYVQAPDNFVVRNGFTRRQPGCFYVLSPHYIVHQDTLQNRFIRSRHIQYANERMTPRPVILQANSLIRKEALPVFYKMNDFVFEGCGCYWPTRWMFNVVQPEHLKYIKSITWDGPLMIRGEETLDMSENTFAHMSTIIMLKQLKILGDCKIRLTPQNCEALDFACILLNKISGVIERKALTAAHARNESGTVDEAEVNGLVYCVAKKLSDLCNHLNEDYSLNYHSSGLGENADWTRVCDCDELENRDMIPWLGRKLVSGADGST